MFPHVDPHSHPDVRGNVTLALRAVLGFEPTVVPFDEPTWAFGEPGTSSRCGSCSGATPFEQRSRPSERDIVDLPVARSSPAHAPMPNTVLRSLAAHPGTDLAPTVPVGVPPCSPRRAAGSTVRIALTSALLIVALVATAVFTVVRLAPFA